MRTLSLLRFFDEGRCQLSQENMIFNDNDLFAAGRSMITHHLAPMTIGLRYFRYFFNS